MIPRYRETLPGFILGILFIAVAVYPVSTVFSSPETPVLQSDTTLTERVRHSLEQVSGLDPQAIEFRIQDGVVVISGTVNNLLSKDRVTHIIQQERGVRSVVNNLTIPSTRSDALIERDLKRVLQQNPTTIQWKVWGEVRDQIITLKGRVQSWRARNYVEELCKGIKGVRSIRNQVEVARRDEISDAEVEKQIEALLRWDNRIDDSSLEVLVNQRKAVLVGSLPNAHQKRLAIEQAHITGITSVDAGNLRVDPAAMNYDGKSITNNASTPAQIEKAIRRALPYDPRIENTRQITFDIRNDTATISGTVDHLVEKLAVGRITAQTVGVQEVKNNLSIDRPLNKNSPVPLTDSAIQKRLKEAFQRDPYLSRYQIKVTVNHGMVTLEGSVSSTYEQIHAGSVASQVMGTLGVNNKIKVREGT